MKQKKKLREGSIKVTMKIGHMKCNILICGSGSIGGLLVAVLSKVAHVRAYDIDSKLVKKIKKNGITLINTRNIKKTYRINITDKIGDLKGMSFDLIIFATKCYDTNTAAKEVAKYCKSSKVLSLQNGMENAEILESHFPKSSVYWGVTDSAANMFKPGMIKIFLIGSIYLGAYKGSYEGALSIGKILRRAGLKEKVLKNPIQAVWSKLIFNSVMNPFPVITNCDYGAVRRSEDAYALIKRAMGEGKTVAARLGVELYFNPLRVAKELKVGKYDKFHHMGSMYYDFIKNKKTEIDYITGKIVQEAESLNIKVPTLETMYKLVKVLEYKGPKNGR